MEYCIFVDHNFKVHFFTGINNIIIVFIFVPAQFFAEYITQISKCDSNDYKNARH